MDHWPEYFSFDVLNLFDKLIVLLQGKMSAMFRSADKVATSKAKLELWGQQVNIGILGMFQMLAEILKDIGWGLSL